MHDFGTITTKRSILFGAAILLAFTAACGASEGMEDEDMMERLGAAREEVHRHHTATSASPSLLALRSEGAIHDEKMSRILGGLDHAMDGMRHCSRDGMEAMQGVLDGMHTAMHGHTEALEQATELESARRACDGHTMAMSGMLTDFDGAVRGAHCSMMEP